MRLKRKVWPLLVMCSVALALATDTSTVKSQQPDQVGSRPVVARNVAPFMQQKLAHSKEVLEGLVLRDYGRIGKHAQQISLMSLDTSWQVVQSTEYAEKSAQFRVSANELAEAAREENIDAATIAYVKMTMQCVDCHKRIPGWQNVPASVAPTNPVQP